ncbi:MAG: hypothetical protein RJB66_2448 [Pseudomonadota bacterium]|jgi:two-component system NtrC family sensor kinase
MNKSPKSRSKKSLRWILALWFLLFSIVPLVFLTYYSIDKFEQTVDNELVQRLQGNLSEIRVIITDFQKALSQQQLAYINNSELQKLLAKNDRRAIADLIADWQSNSTASIFTLYNENGQLLAETSKNLQVSATPGESKKQISLHDKIRSRLSKSQQILLVPDYETPQALNLSLISPVFIHQSLAGYLKQSLSLDGRFLRRISERMQIHAILLEPNGRIIVGSHPDFLLYKNNFFEEFSKKHGGPPLSVSLRGEPLGFMASTLQWGTTDVKIALAASKKASNIAIDNLRVAYYTLLATMFAVLVLSVLAASNVVLRPLSELIEAIQDLHLGENIIELPIKSDNEIGQLTTSFNDLSRRILATQRALKDKIKELEEANNDLKDTQGQLVQSAKMASLGQLVAGVAHELNNPIGFIYSNMTHLRDYSNKLITLVDTATVTPNKLEDLKAEYDLEYIRKDLPKLITSCEEGARRTKDIVIGLRNFSRIEEKAYRPMDVHESIETTLGLLNSEFKNRITVEKDFGSLPQIICNQTQINQVFMNILSNAAQAIEGRGTVWITTKAIALAEGSPTQVSVSIQDNGPGVPPDLLQKIFDPFFTTKRVGQGTGLGLAISYGIIHSHGGTIKVSSKVGVGTEFIITLPIEPSKQNPEIA